MYESDHTKFMRELMQQKPHLRDDQKTGRAIWWDKFHDPAELVRFQESRVKQQAYVYQNKL